MSYVVNPICAHLLLIPPGAPSHTPDVSHYNIRSHAPLTFPPWQAPESIKREAAPTTGELYTVPENKKGSKKKKETTPPEYSQVDLQKKHQPPSGVSVRV